MNGPARGLTPALAPRRPQREPQPGQVLVVALDCDRPHGPPSRHLLDGLDAVIVGRADGERVVRRAAPEHMLYLGIPDRWMSAAHAKLVREGLGFRIEDTGSTNGTRVNGRLVEQARLEDGDVVELGHTLLLFASACAGAADASADVDASCLREPLPAFATLVPALADEFARTASVAVSSLPVLILGETGTGKELAARAVHAISRRSGPFLAVNCGAIAPTLMESELFGYRKGAFTGASEAHPGLIRAAGGGTLFLDEIGDLSLTAQTALLRVLQESEVRAVGSTEPVKVDVRVVAATHVDMERSVEQGKFRADLRARIEGFVLRLPALRERPEDIGLLTRTLLRKLAPGRAPSVSTEAGRALLVHRWPANIRELERALGAALVLAGTGPIELAHLPGAVQRALAEPQRGQPKINRRDDPRREELVALLREHGGNVAAVARAMGKARNQIHRWLHRYDVALSDFRR